jgi:hypothetical protein
MERRRNICLFKNEWLDFLLTWIISFELLRKIKWCFSWAISYPIMSCWLIVDYIALTHRRERTAENSCFYQATGELMSAFHFLFDVKWQFAGKTPLALYSWKVCHPGSGFGEPFFLMIKKIYGGWKLVVLTLLQGLSFHICY